MQPPLINRDCLLPITVTGQKINFATSPNSNLFQGDQQVVLGNRLQLLMRDINTGTEKLVMYQVDTVIQPDEAAKSEIKAETENIQRDLSARDSQREEVYDSLKPCFEEIAQKVQRPKSAGKPRQASVEGKSSSQKGKNKLRTRICKGKGSLATQVNSKGDLLASAGNKSTYSLKLNIPAHSSNLVPQNDQDSDKAKPMNLSPMPEMVPSP